MARKPKTPAATDATGSETPESPVSVDVVLKQLESTVGELEDGELPLEDALSRFEEGVRLAQVGNKLLDRLEHKVEQLLEGRDEPAPFAEDTKAEDDNV